MDHEAFTPTLTGSLDGAKLKLRLARLDREREEKREREQREAAAKTQKAEHDQQLAMRRLELEFQLETAIRLRKLELESSPRTVAPSTFSTYVLPSTVVAPTSSTASPGSLASTASSTPPGNYDLFRHIELPPFRETEVDAFFQTFERLATVLNWPKDNWSTLLQCKLTGKAQHVIASLPLADSLDYDVCKSAVLRAYELVPEAYRQQFRNYKKSSTQTFVEFAREKGELFDKWCAASKVTDFAGLRELILLEEFKKCASERCVVYLNEKKVSKLNEAAIFADEYKLTHKEVFGAPRGKGPSATNSTPPVGAKEERECYYCHTKGHVQKDCFQLKKKNSSSSKPANVKPTGFVRTVSEQAPNSLAPMRSDGFKPFTFEGMVSLVGDPSGKKPIRILRDTGAAQSFLLIDVLPLSDASFSGAYSIAQGIDMSFIKVPLHNVLLDTKLVSGCFKVAVRPALPVQNIDLIMGNDIAGDKVCPVLEVIERPDALAMPCGSDVPPDVFPACVLTRAQARKESGSVDLSDSILATPLATDVFPQHSRGQAKLKSVSVHMPAIKLPVNRNQIVAAQKADPTLAHCFELAISPAAAKEKPIAYFVEDDLLMRKWSMPAAAGMDWGVVTQVVMPTPFRHQVLLLAHGTPWSGHLGITKTYNRVLKHFFWPKLRASVAQFCKTCHHCQITGKPNQTVPAAPLCPIPVMGEPFSHVIVDCVGPLPKTRNGNQYLLTLMCTATRFPEAIPLRVITAKAVVKAMTKFFSTFGFAKVVQTDQGTNFLSRVFETQFIPIELRLMVDLFA